MLFLLTQFLDDWYEGMLIPKDSTLFIATWAIHHTEELFPDHDTFDPERYVDHPKLANDYAGSPEWSSRDKSCRFLLSNLTNWLCLSTSLWLWCRPSSLPRSTLRGA